MRRQIHALITGMIISGFLLYACNKPATIVFEKNSSEAEGMMQPLTVEPDTSTDLTPSAFTRPNWVFAGWAPSPSGTTIYRDGATVRNLKKDITLYARWVHPSLAQINYRDMVFIKGDTFLQQWDRGGDIDEFKNTVSDYYLARYEVTYELWYTVYQWATKHGYHFIRQGKEGDIFLESPKDGTPPSDKKLEPVTCISWGDAVVWCNAYSEMTDRTPCYLDNGEIMKDARVIPYNDKTNKAGIRECLYPECNWDADGYRLPTEGEWLFAAGNRGETPHDYASGAEDDIYNEKATGEVAWFRFNSDKHTHNVGTTPRSNELSIYDMSGNAEEWVWDLYASYPKSSQNNYRGPLHHEQYTRNGRIIPEPVERISIGSDYNANNGYCYKHHNYDGRSHGMLGVGFRIALAEGKY